MIELSRLNTIKVKQIIRSILHNNLEAIFYSIIYIQYGAYTRHIIIGHSCVEYKEEVFVMIVYDRLWITLKKKILASMH